MNLSSLWMLSHAFCAIKAGLGFHLKADVTGKVCWKIVDLLAFSVTSIPRCNKTMCLCIILKPSESKQAFRVVYDEYAKQCALCPASTIAAKRIVFLA